MPVFEKVNALTFKLKTHLGKVGGQASMVGEEERKRADQWRRPTTCADEKDIEFQLAHLNLHTAYMAMLG